MVSLVSLIFFRLKRVYYLHYNLFFSNYFLVMFVCFLTLLAPFCCYLCLTVLARKSLFMCLEPSSIYFLFYFLTYFITLDFNILYNIILLYLLQFTTFLFIYLKFLYQVLYFCWIYTLGTLSDSIFVVVSL